MSLIENLTVEMDDFRLDIPRWELLDQGVTALIGPSGSGKSTVFRTLLGLNPCPRLRWMMEGTDLAKVSVRERRLGVVFQTLDLFPHLTARENIQFAAAARRLPITEADNLMQELITELRMESFIDRRASLCSGGERQRTALARAIIGKPRMLFLDEPFSALDEELRDEARGFLQTLLRRFQIPTLLVTHDPRDVSILADKISSIRNGKILSEQMVKEAP